MTNLETTAELEAAYERIAELELARDTARSRHIAALEEIERWKDASGLECGGDPDGVTPDGMRRFWEKVERERDEARRELRARRWLDEWQKTYPAGGSRELHWVADELRVRQCGHLIGYFADHEHAATALGRKEDDDR